MNRDEIGHALGASWYLEEPDWFHHAGRLALGQNLGADPGHWWVDIVDSSGAEVRWDCATIEDAIAIARLLSEAERRMLPAGRGR